MKKQINLESQQIVFTFEGLDAVVLNVPKLSDEVLEYAQYHGLQARIGDNAAISRKGPNGEVITVTEAMRREAVLELVNHYESGATKWELKSASRSHATEKSLKAAAELIAELTGVTPEAAMADIRAKATA